MIVHPTNSYGDKLRIVFKRDVAIDPLYAWRANWVKRLGRRVALFMNEMTKFVVVINDAELPVLKNIEEHFHDVLGKTLQRIGVDQAIIDQYQADLGDFIYTKNTDGTIIATHNHVIRELPWAMRRTEDNVELSYLCSNRSIPSRIGEPPFRPLDEMLEALSRYGSPVRKTTAADLTVRLGFDDKETVRRLRVPANISFARLHDVLQAAFEWKNAHPHSFTLSGTDGETVLADGDALSDHAAAGTEIVYTYESGYEWRHHIMIDSIIEGCEDVLPVLLSGEGDVPKEDASGPTGWASRFAETADPDDPDYEWQKQWAESQRWRRFDYESLARKVANLA